MDKNVLAALGLQIRERRLELGVTRREVEYRAGLGAGSVSRLEAGGRSPAADTLLRLCVALDCVFQINRTGICLHIEGAVEL